MIFFILVYLFFFLGLPLDFLPSVLSVTPSCFHRGITSYIFLPWSTLVFIYLGIYRYFPISPLAVVIIDIFHTCLLLKFTVFGNCGVNDVFIGVYDVRYRPVKPNGKFLTRALTRKYNIFFIPLTHFILLFLVSSPLQLQISSLSFLFVLLWFPHSPQTESLKGPHDNWMVCNHIFPFYSLRSVIAK